MADVLSPLLAFGAGALTILSPCVLPLVPIVLGSAAQRHRLGPLALTTGLVASFTLVGFVVAAFGNSVGIDSEATRFVGAVLLVLAGVLLLAPVMQTLLAHIATPLADWASARQTRLERFGLAGQAGIGVLLGLVWSPCIGPTLGAATALAAQGENLGQVFLVMLAFGLGIATVLLAIATTTRSFLTRWRGRLMSAGGGGKRALGVVLIVVGVMIFSGVDRILEGFLVSASPEWLTDLTTMI
jgi:cytochrome c-type biogenesis protein